MEIQEFKCMLEAQLANKNTFTDDTLRLRHLVGEKVRTPDGAGVLLGSTLPDSNGLYFRDNRKWLVWFGSGNRWAQKTYEGNQIAAIENHLAEICNSPTCSKELHPHSHLNARNGKYFYCSDKCMLGDL